MFWILIATLCMAGVMVSVLSKMLTVALVVIAVLLSALIWQSWRHRR